MIPGNIKRIHIIQACGEMEKEGIPECRLSYGFSLLVGGKKYPPKYAICLANKFANGEILGTNELDGGRQTNRFLKRKGFEIVPIEGRTR